MEEAYTKKYRRKPLHRKIVRKRSIVKSRSVLRNGTELRSFKEFMQEDSHKCYEEDHRDGYKAGVEFHMGSGVHEENPHNQDTHPECHAAWKDGFEQAGEDS